MTVHVKRVWRQTLFLEWALYIWISILLLITWKLFLMGLWNYSYRKGMASKHFFGSMHCTFSSFFFHHLKMQAQIPWKCWQSRRRPIWSMYYQTIANIWSVWCFRMASCFDKPGSYCQMGAQYVYLNRSNQAFQHWRLYWENLHWAH